MLGSVITEPDQAATARTQQAVATVPLGVDRKAVLRRLQIDLHQFPLVRRTAGASPGLRLRIATILKTPPTVVGQVMTAMPAAVDDVAGIAPQVRNDLRVHGESLYAAGRFTHQLALEHEHQHPVSHGT